MGIKAPPAARRLGSNIIATSAASAVLVILFQDELNCRTYVRRTGTGTYVDLTL